MMWTVLGEVGRHHLDFLSDTGSGQISVTDTGTLLTQKQRDLQQMILDLTGHPAAEHEGLLHPGGCEELQRVVDHGNVTQRQQSLHQ